jgi:hypothetical protein
VASNPSEGMKYANKDAFTWHERVADELCHQAPVRANRGELSA